MAVNISQIAELIKLIGWKAYTEEQILARLQKVYNDTRDWYQVDREYLLLLCDTLGQDCFVEQVVSSAIQLGHYKIFEWAVENKAAVTSYSYALLMMKGHLDFIECLYKNNVPYGDTEYLGQIIAGENWYAFMKIYGESWESGRFDVPLPCDCPKPAKV